jgi:hypothetical protein
MLQAIDLRIEAMIAHWMLMGSKPPMVHRNWPSQTEACCLNAMQCDSNTEASMTGKKPHPKSNATRSRARLRHGLHAEVFNSLIIHDDTIVAHNTVVAVAVVRVQRDVCIHFKVWEGVLEFGDGPL